MQKCIARKIPNTVKQFNLTTYSIFGLNREDGSLRGSKGNSVRVKRRYAEAAPATVSGEPESHKATGDIPWEGGFRR
jgi:hypothetical protein